MWKDLSMREKAAAMKVAIKNGIYDLKEILDSYNKFAKGGPVEKYNYPEVTIKDEPWADEYFRNNPNIAGMAIGEGLNGIAGPRRVIVNPYNKNMNNPVQRASLIKNERLRHYMDETNFKMSNLYPELINMYKGTPYENDTINIGRTEVARYLTGDKSHHLNPLLINYVNLYKRANNIIFNKFAKGGNTKDQEVSMEYNLPEVNIYPERPLSEGIKRQILGAVSSLLYPQQLITQIPYNVYKYNYQKKVQDDLDEEMRNLKRLYAYVNKEDRKKLDKIIEFKEAENRRKTRNINYDQQYKKYKSNQNKLTSNYQFPYLFSNEINNLILTPEQLFYSNMLGLTNPYIQKLSDPYNILNNINDNYYFVRDIFNNRFGKGGYTITRGNITDKPGWAGEGTLKHPVLTAQKNGDYFDINFPDIEIIANEPTTDADKMYKADLQALFGTKALSKLENLAEWTDYGDIKEQIEIAKMILAGDYKGAAERLALNVGYYTAGAFIPFLSGKAVKKIHDLFKKGKKVQNYTLELVSKWTDKDWDKAYNKAIKNKNKELVQLLRNLHFKTKAPNTKIIDSEGNLVHMYHGTPNKWNVYDRKYFGSATDNGFYGEGLYTTSHKDYAKTYSESYGTLSKKGEVKDLYLNIEKPFYVETSDNMDAKDLVNREDAAFMFNRPKLFQNRGDVPEDVYNEMLNSDGVIDIKGNKRPNFSEVVVPEPSQFKLANSITYDDNGNIIPLSKRDNFNAKDIRYSLVPLLGTYLGYNYLKSDKNETRRNNKSTR